MTAGRKMNLILNIILLLLVALCIFPVLLTLIISFSSSESITEVGYALIPKSWSLDAYKYIFADPLVIGRAYGITIFNAVAGTVIGIFVVSLYAYSLTIERYKFRKFFTYFMLVTMLFNGGMVASYIVNIQVLHLGNTIWIMILPLLFNAWNVVIMRTFIQTSVPKAVIESAKIDGATEWRVFFKIVMPMSVPGIASVSFFILLAIWNDWNLPLLYITNDKLYNLQFLLQRIMKSIEIIKNNPEYAQAAKTMTAIPTESARMALCFVALGPILIAYPFFQKYFIQGITVGSVKG
ncbi:MAG: carbohydrate ABC transporter permease [Clostridia bacterium]|nr:carbohydrate ABC transporter permease [Clostridia bacterium]